MANIKSQVLRMYTYLAGTFQFGLAGNGERQVTSVVHIHLPGRDLCVHVDGGRHDVNAVHAHLPYLIGTTMGWMLMANGKTQVMYTHAYLAGTFALELDADGERDVTDSVHSHLPGRYLCACTGR